MTHPFSSGGAKAPAKPYTATKGERRIRRFVLRGAAGSTLFESIQRVATRWRNPPTVLTWITLAQSACIGEPSDD